jgi:dTDP-4-amino-4,6-dideoxygalactose transaminase
VLSFHATKFFNTFEGGAVVTNSDELADRVRLMRNFGFVDFDDVIYPGTNGKMTEICAAMGLVNLTSLDSFVMRNRENYAAYANTFAGSNQLSLLPYDVDIEGNHQYVVVELSPTVVNFRDRLVADLHSENIRARKYFWPGCHMMEPYKSLSPHAGMCLPSTSRVAERVIVLPTGSAVDASDCHRIADYILSRLGAY